MSYPISQLKDELTGVQHGTTLSQITGLYEIFNRAAREVLADFDPIETVRIQQLTSPLYDKVFDYASPADLKGDRIIDVRPQVRRTVADRFAQYYNQEFDLQKLSVASNPLWTIQYNNGTKSLRVAKNLTPAILLNAVSSITDNGTWVVGGSASNLTADTLNYATGSGSLKFDLAAGGVGSTGYIENTTMEAVDLTRDLNEGSEFAWFYVQTASHVTNVILRWGQDASNYWTNTVTTTAFGTALANGWNLLKFDWLTATKVGSPDVTKTAYAQATVTYDGTALPACRFDAITSQLGTIYEIEYYSKFLFRDAATGVFQETVASDNDIINLDTDSYNVYFNLVAYFAAQQVQGTDGQFDVAFYKNEYEKARDRYKAKIRSQVTKPTSVYYAMPKKKVTYIRYSSG